MATLKPYYVELRYDAIVMAESGIDAILKAEDNASKICNDQECEADVISELRSLEHMNRLAPEWDGECRAYGSKEALKNLLPPEDPPEPDTKTIDMFAA